MIKIGISIVLITTTKKVHFHGKGNWKRLAMIADESTINRFEYLVVAEVYCVWGHSLKSDHHHRRLRCVGML